MHFRCKWCPLYTKVSYISNITYNWLAEVNVVVSVVTVVISLSV